MRLSLSVRIAESFKNKFETTLPLEALANLAQELRYDAICMRASVLGVESPREAVDAARELLERRKLPVSMVTGDFAVPLNDRHGPDGLREIEPYLDLAAALGTDLIRVCMKVEEDIPWAQRAADQAAERGIRLVHQSHLASLFETVSGSVETLRAIDRPNFGIIYEPANWMLSGQDYIGAVRELAPWIVNVYVQNHRIDPGGRDVLCAWTRGDVRFEHIGLWDEGGVDFPAVFDALRGIGYDGYVTVHQSVGGTPEAPIEAARRSMDYLEPLVRE